MTRTMANAHDIPKGWRPCSQDQCERYFCPSDGETYDRHDSRIQYVVGRATILTHLKTEEREIWERRELIPIERVGRNAG